MSDVRPTGASLMPCLSYRNAPAMIEWLCEVLGCAKKMVVPGEDGTVAHAELTLGRGMLMVGSATKSENEYAKLIKQPDEIGGCETQSVYVVVADADAVYALAKQRGGTRSSWRSKTKTTAAAASASAIPKGISGTSAPTIRGRSVGLVGNALRSVPRVRRSNRTERRRGRSLQVVAGA